MKIVFDTNVIYDILGERQPFVETSAKAMKLVGRHGGVIGAITANTITDIFYLYQKHQPNKAKCKEVLHGLMTRLTIIDTTRALCFMALESPMPDFEDALLAESASEWSADYIITRNTKDFSNSPVAAITPDEFLRQFPAQ